MKRREFIAGLGGAAAWPLAALAQQSPRLRRIGVLAGAADDSVSTGRSAAFQQGLQQLGWTDGANVTIVYVRAEAIRVTLPNSQQNWSLFRRMSLSLLRV